MFYCWYSIGFVSTVSVVFVRCSLVNGFNRTKKMYKRMLSDLYTLPVNVFRYPFVYSFCSPIQSRCKG